MTLETCTVNNMTNKSRVHWIDIVKGILILLMVLGHIPNIASRQGIDESFLVKCIFFTSLYTCFFMQAFLILTGYTSSFDKKPIEFYTSILKTLIIPWFSFSIISKFIHFLFLDAEWFYTFEEGGGYFFLFEDYWFLHVIILSKIAYYYIYKYINNDIIRASVFLMLMIIGFGLFAHQRSSGHAYHYHNYLHYKDFLCMAFWIFLGNWLKRADLVNKFKVGHIVLIMLLYIAGHVIRFALRINNIDNIFITPVVISHSCNISSIVQVPTYIFYVITGSLSIFGITKYIGQNKLLEYFGRNSLTVYCVHFVILNALTLLVYEVIQPNNIIMALLFICMVFILCILSCCCICYITKFKPFNYLIGKF